MISDFRKWCDEYCYENFDCNLPALLNSNGMIPSIIFKQFFEAIESEFIIKVEDRCCENCRYIDTNNFLTCDYLSTQITSDEKEYLEVDKDFCCKYWEKKE